MKIVVFVSERGADGRWHFNKLIGTFTLLNFLRSWRLLRKYYPGFSWKRA